MRPFLRLAAALALQPAFACGPQAPVAAEVVEGLAPSADEPSAAPPKTSAGPAAPPGPSR